MSKDAAKHRKPATRSRPGMIALTVAALSSSLFAHGCNSGTDNSPLVVAQTKLDGNCFAKFAISLPVFGPAGAIPRVDAAAHPNLTVTMTETNQQVLPPGSYVQCGSGVTFGQTRVWTYQTTWSGALAGSHHRGPARHRYPRHIRQQTAELRSGSPWRSWTGARRIAIRPDRALG
jgi:spore coat protein A, manganese oxidase